MYRNIEAYYTGIKACCAMYRNKGLLDNVQEHRSLMYRNKGMLYNVQEHRSLVYRNKGLLCNVQEYTRLQE